MPSTHRQRRPAFFWLVIAACPLFAATFSVTVYLAVHHFGAQKAPGWNVRVDRAGWIVTDIEKGGPADGRLEDGDRLLAINNDRQAAIIGVSYWRHVEPDSTYRVDVERRGGPVSVDLVLPTAPIHLLDYYSILYGLVFVGFGAALGLLRPDDRLVRLVALCLTGFAAGTLSAGLAVIRGSLAGWEAAAYFLIVSPTPLVFPLTYHVFTRFPTGSDPGRAWRVVQWVLYLLFALVFWPTWVLHYLGTDIGQRPTRFLVDHATLYLTANRVHAVAGWLFYLACLVLALVVTARNYRRLDSADSRRRIRIVVAALLIAVVPFAIVQGAYRLGAIGEYTFRSFAGSSSFSLMILIPVALAVAVWKEQLFDIKVLVRRGLQYLLAQTALRVLLVLPIALLLLSIFRNPDRTIAQILTQGAGWLNVLLIGAVAAALQSRQRLQVALDRRFFREAYQQEQVLVHLIDEVRRLDSLADIAKLVSTRIDSVLHPTELHVFYRADEQSGRFERQSSVDVANSNLPASFEGRIDDMEREWLARSPGHLAVPIAGSGERIVGMLLLGDRKSDEPYADTDRRLLRGIASQIGLVYENQHLHERVRRDADVRRDVLARLDDRISLLKECPTCGTCFDGAVTHCDRDGMELALTLPIERTLDGKYRLDRALGRGGFGAVFEATDLRLQRRVAAKVMLGSTFGDRAALRRFEREARAAARIDHPNITRVHDYGVVGSGGAFLIMELIAGRTWRQELHRGGSIVSARAAQWFRQLLDGLRFAHGLGVVHRDLKPENVMIVDGPSGDAVKIMDFGLAKVMDSGPGVTESVTAAGTAMGTLGYMAPEVLTGGAIDERADLFAIGVMAVETLTGARPFRGQTQQETLVALLHHEYHLPGQSPEVRALDAIVQRCLAKDPRDRYASAEELAADLIPAVARCDGFGPAESVVASDAPTQ